MILKLTNLKPCADFHCTLNPGWFSQRHTDITDSLTEFIQANSDRKRQRIIIFGLSVGILMILLCLCHSASIMKKCLSHKTQGKLNDADSLTYL